ncbi:MAG: EamA family transporter [Cyclobacteriaceae bacterium]|nr:EamA family transporter [Cyclobacteriaceae bacterium]
MRLSNSILFLVPALIWGSTWYVIKFQIGDTDALFSVGYRFILAGAILVLYSLLKGLPMRFPVKNHLFIALQGACLFGFNYWLIYMSEAQLTSGLVAVIFVWLIFMNVILSAVFLKSPVRVNVVFGGLVGVVGIGLLFKDELRMFDFSDRNFVAFLLALGSTTLASCGNILSAYNQKQKMPVIQTNAYGMLYGAVFVLAVAIFTGGKPGFNLHFSYLISLLYLSVFGSVIAFTAYLNLLGKIGPDRAGYISLVTPVIALLISTIFENYQWTATGFFGLMLILIGILLALQPKTWARTARSLN